MHGCLYCYVPDVLRRHSSERCWGEYVHVKEGLLERLKADVKHARPGIIGVSTVTDPYQPVEKELELTRQALSIIGSTRLKASIQTKSSLVSRDLDLIKTHGFELGVTISSLDDTFRKKFELHASPPEERAIVLEEASSMGIKTWIFYGPIILGHNDSSEVMDAIAQLAAKTGSSILYDRLNLKPYLRQRLLGPLTPAELQAIAQADFSAVYRRLISICKSRGVAAKFAF